MRFIRYQVHNQPPTAGWVEDDLVGAVEGSIFGGFRRLEARLPLADVQLLPPLLPGKILCVGRNYAEHAKEMGNDVPDVPLVFMKPNNTLIGHGATIYLPPQSTHVEHEGELVIVIGKGGRWISPEDAPDHIFGYTLANDITARDFQRKDNQWTRAKGFDTFCPLGPWIDTEYKPVDELLTCHVNGNMRQMGSVRDMVFTIPQLIAYFSTFLTLDPGDIILTGTPAGVGPLMDGDTVEVKLEPLGTLTNPVLRETR